MAGTVGGTHHLDDQRQRSAWLLVGLLWAGYLALEVLGASGWGHTLAKGLLMPTLLLWVLVALRGAAPRLLVAGLVLATVGDVGLEFDATFLVGMAGFLGMQVCYVLGFLGMGAWANVRRQPWIAVGYLVFWVVANLVLGPRLGDLQGPIALYSLALCVMASVAAGVDRRIAMGGLLFLISDMLIGLDLADLGFPGRGLVVMATYLGAQYLIVTGWARRVDARVVVPG
ncbi:MAG: lysoplasmalogenase [Candidatus Nanopelagicales bacterium]